MASPWEANGSSGGTRAAENAAAVAAGVIIPRGVPPGVVFIASGADPADKGRPWPPKYDPGVVGGPMEGITKLPDGTNTGALLVSWAVGFMYNG
jgi:hypothetical protein